MRSSEDNQAEKRAHVNQQLGYFSIQIGSFLDPALIERNRSFYHKIEEAYVNGDITHTEVVDLCKLVTNQNMQDLSNNNAKNTLDPRFDIAESRLSLLVIKNQELKELETLFNDLKKINPEFTASTTLTKPYEEAISEAKKGIDLSEDTAELKLENIIANTRKQKEEALRHKLQNELDALKQEITKSLSENNKKTTDSFIGQALLAGEANKFHAAFSNVKDIPPEELSKKIEQTHALTSLLKDPQNQEKQEACKKVFPVEKEAKSESLFSFMRFLQIIFNLIKKNKEADPTREIKERLIQELKQAPKFQAAKQRLDTTSSSDNSPKNDATPPKRKLSR